MPTSRWITQRYSNSGCYRRTRIRSAASVTFVRVHVSALYKENGLNSKHVARGRRSARIERSQDKITRQWTVLGCTSIRLLRFSVDVVTFAANVTMTGGRAPVTLTSVSIYIYIYIYNGVKEDEDGDDTEAGSEPHTQSASANSAVMSRHWCTADWRHAPAIDHLTLSRLRLAYYE